MKSIIIPEDILIETMKEIDNGVKYKNLTHVRMHDSINNDSKYCLSTLISQVKCLRAKFQAVPQLNVADEPTETSTQNANEEASGSIANEEESGVVDDKEEDGSLYLTQTSRPTLDDSSEDELTEKYKDIILMYEESEAVSDFVSLLSIYLLNYIVYYSSQSSI